MVERRFDERPSPSVTTHNEVEPLEIIRQSIATPFILRDGSYHDKPRRILDVGCGTGRKTLLLGAANPSCHVLGIDFSANSIEVCNQSFPDAAEFDVEFSHSTLEDVVSHCRPFDYINFDDSFYLMASPVSSLRVAASALTSNGIIRANLHTISARQRYLNAARVLKLLNCLELPEQELMERVKHLYRALNQKSRLYRETTRSSNDVGFVMANHALAGDKACSFDETLGLMEKAELQIFQMYDFESWQISSAMSPVAADGAIAQQVASLSWNDQLRFIDAAYCDRRLYDFWCSPRNAECNLGAQWPGRSQRGNSIEKLTIHPGALCAGLLEECSLAFEEARAASIQRFTRFMSGQPSGPPPSLISEVLTIIGVDGLAFTELLETWARYRPLRPENLASQTEDGASRELNRCIDYLMSAGLVLT